MENLYGLHGNGILSRFPITHASVVRMPGMDSSYPPMSSQLIPSPPISSHAPHLFQSLPISSAVSLPSGMDALYNSKGFATAGGYERRLGGRMTLLARTKTSDGTELGVGAIHAQTSWGRDAAHTNRSIEGISQRMEATLGTHYATSVSNPAVVTSGHVIGTSHAIGAAPMPMLLGGDTWPLTCEWLGLTKLVRRASPSSKVDADGKVRLSRGRMDDYICGGGVQPAGPHTVVAPAGRRVNGSGEFVLSDHSIVHVTLGVDHAASAAVTAAAAASAAAAATSAAAASSSGATASLGRSSGRRAPLQVSATPHWSAALHASASAGADAHRSLVASPSTALSKDHRSPVGSPADLPAADLWPKGVPRQIHMCYKTSQIPQQVRDAWTSLNPGFGLGVHSDADCHAFLLRYYGEEIAGIYARIPHG